MKPDAKKYNPDISYLRSLVDCTGLSQRKVAAIIGVNERVFRAYIADRNTKSALTAPYPVQFSLECLADSYK